MIEGYNFNNQEIAKLEQKNADEYFKSNDANLFSDAIQYYSELFQNFLKQHVTQGFLDKDEKDQVNVLQEEDRRFVYSMTYAFMKGHQDCYALILANFQQKIKFTKSFFEEPKSKIDFLNMVFAQLPDSTYQKKLNRDRVYSLVQFTRDNFENARNYILKLANIFYMKGASVAYDQIAKNLVQANVKISGYSKILHVPYNAPFAVTPAFSAVFDMEHLNTESWDISWDFTYGEEAQNVLVAKLILNRFTRQEVNAYADVEAISYQAIREFFENNSNNADPNDILYQAQIIFPIQEDNLRLVSGLERTKMLEGLQKTICHQLGIKANQIMFRIK